MAPANCNGEEELARLVAALRALEIVPSKDVAWDRSPALRVIDCVLSLNRPYDSFVVPRLRAFGKDGDDILSVRDLRTMIEG
jgi:hypothetical protein